MCLDSARQNKLCHCLYFAKDRNVIKVNGIGVPQSDVLICQNEASVNTPSRLRMKKLEVFTVL